MSRRVVVTGIGLATPIGNSYREVKGALRAQRHGIRTLPEWQAIRGLGTQLAATVDVDLSGYSRKKVRSMGRVALLSTFATQQAIDDAGLSEEELRSGDLGLAYGSTHGSTSALERFCRTLFVDDSLRGIAGTAYLKFMSHTCAANLAQFYGIRGRVVSCCAACVSGSQAIGSGYELIKHGVQETMLCGGAEEMHYLHAGVFDIMFATSTRNDSPAETPRPFDRHRDGLVIGEGAGTLVLESYDKARRRGARIYGEIIGYGMSCDGTHITTPSVGGMEEAMRRALSDAEISRERVDYVNAHATATEIGDICESKATAAVLGTGVPISSTKGYTGHTLGACGAIEAAFCLATLEDGYLPASRNLREVDPRCAPLDFLLEPRDLSCTIVMSNNFAFGGINTSLLFGLV